MVLCGEEGPIMWEEATCCFWAPSLRVFWTFFGTGEFLEVVLFSF